MGEEKISTHNSFSDKQYDYMYSDTGFVEFISTYFSTYCTINQFVFAKIEDDRTNNYFLALRIILANFSNFIKYVNEIITNMSYSYSKSEKAYQSEMRGKLNMNKYVQEVIKGSLPRTYSCSVKEKTYVNPENLYLVYIMKDVSSWLTILEKIFDEINISKKEISKELHLLGVYKRIIDGYVSKSKFSACRDELIMISRKYGAAFPRDLMDLIERRLIQGKIRNSSSYQRLINWYKQFDNITKLTKVNEQTLNILRYDSDIFADRIFELWNLYRIKETFVKECNCTVEEEYGITTSNNECKFVLRTYKGDIIRLIFQKGEDLYWNEEHSRTWKYIDGDTDQELRGIPDISIEFISEDNLLIMVDVKNRIKERRRSAEEIYKMIGYYTNFQQMIDSQYSKTIQRRAVLLVRNDYSAVDEELEDNGGAHRLRVLSVSPVDDENLNYNQFKKLCSYVLNSKGIEGTLSSVFSSYSKDVQEEVAEVEGDAEDKAYRITIKNHELIEALFNDQSLQDKLEQYKIELSKNYFPHIWDKMDDDVKKILSMAECLYTGMTDCEGVDCAPICLEYCRALEVQINHQILRPFRDSNDIDALARRNKFYEKMKEERDMTLGECMYFFEKCNHNRYPMIEFKNFIINELHNGNKFIDEGVELIRTINEQIRRRSAHTEILGYADLILARQRILGIGFERLFYLLLDER